MQPEPFVRGAAWPAVDETVPYPRADPQDFARLPLDTWYTAQVPAGVRLELEGDATTVEIAYSTATDDLGYRGPGAGRTFVAVRGADPVDERDAVLGEGKVRLSLGEDGDERAVVHLPEGMKPTIAAIEGVDGAIQPGPRRPRWLAYGDSITEGWIASGPARAWPALASRDLGLDVVNLGYAGAARGELVSAEHIAALEADVISIAHGTNCWTRVPHSAELVAAGTSAFLEVVRHGHPDTPVVVVSPVVRPDAESQPNKLGATLVDIRSAIEDSVQARIDDGDRRLTLVPGRNLVAAELLADGIHPGDDGHRVLAEVVGRAVVGALEG